MDNIKKDELLFVIPSLKIGGIEKALQNLLENIDYDLYSVTVFLFNCNKEYITMLPPNVKVIHGRRFLKTISMTLDESRNSGIFNYILRGLFAVLCRIFGADLVYSIIFSFEKRIGKYDFAISYMNNGNNKSTYFGCNKFVLEKVNALKKISWLHVDYETMNMNSKINNYEYSNFDAVISVSEAVKDVFLRYNPQLKNRVFTVHNVLEKKIQKNYKDIGECSLAKTILTIGRLDKNKNQIECINIARKLKMQNYEFMWYLIGDGPDRKFLEGKIHEYNLEDVIKITGYTRKKEKYINDAYLSVSTSLSESYGMVVAECLEYGVPVIAKNYPAACELIQNGDNGILVETYDEMFNQISKLIVDYDNYKLLRSRTRRLIKDNEIMNRFYEILENIKKGT